MGMGGYSRRWDVLALFTAVCRVVERGTQRTACYVKEIVRGIGTGVDGIESCNAVSDVGPDTHRRLCAVFYVESAGLTSASPSKCDVGHTQEMCTESCARFA